MNPFNLKPDYDDKPATFVPYEDGGGGNWQQTLWCSNNECVTGFGATKKQAELDAQNKRNKVQEFLICSPTEQISQILAKDKEICWHDLQIVVRHLANLILENKA